MKNYLYLLMCWLTYVWGFCQGSCVAGRCTWCDWDRDVDIHRPITWSSATSSRKRAVRWPTNTKVSAHSSCLTSWSRKVSFRAVSVQFQSSFRAEQFYSSFRAVLEQFQSSFRAVLEQYLKSSFGAVSEHVSSSFRAVFRAVLKMF